jgi:hypothetical protein
MELVHPTNPSDPHPHDNHDTIFKRMAIFLLASSTLGLGFEIGNHSQMNIKEIYQDTKQTCTTVADSVRQRLTQPTEEPLIP